MNVNYPQQTARPTTVLGRLRTDVRGNTIAIMAAALIPMAALAGSAIDVARMYVAKVRLQQACDAGALAGRKFMVDSNGPLIDDNAKQQGIAFFNNNFRSGFMGTTAVNFTPTKTTDKQVAGSATAKVPMTIMKMFDKGDVILNVTCEARYDVPDVDIVFVLDTTGSMACLPEDDDDDCNTYVGNAGTTTYSRPATSGGVAGYAGTTGYAVPEKANSRIAALRTAVKNFYSTLNSNVDPSTHVRYGFVTYSSMVNAGEAIMDMSPGYMLGGSGSGTTKWQYQSRVVTGDYTISTGTTTYNSLSSTNCTGSVRTPAGTSSQPFRYSPTNGRAIVTSYAWNTTKKQCGETPVTVGPVWKYQPVTYDVANFVAGNAVPDPSKVNGASSTWIGCIEERDTTAGAKTFDTANLPADLDPDKIATTDATRWRPMWPDVEYVRPSATSFPSSNGDVTTYQHYNDPVRLKLGKNGCAKPIQRLAVVTADDVKKFVEATDFVAIGGTYHDVGMIWGTRLLSPNGIFAADTAAWEGRPAPKRVIIFLTDGDMSPSVDAYSLYGVEQLDKRVTAGNTDDRKIYHNARFLAECAKAKALNIDVWTVSIAPERTTELTTCASLDSQALFTTTGSGLSTAFQSIAQRVAMLRISK